MIKYDKKLLKKPLDHRISYIETRLVRHKTTVYSIWLVLILFALVITVLIVDSLVSIQKK